MFFFLSKILLFLTYPLVWIMFLLLTSFVFRKKNFSKILMVSATFIFLIFSNTLIFHEVFKSWEGRNDTLNYPVYDAIIVLGGYSNWNTRHNLANYNDGSDRIIRALELYKQGKTKYIVLSGGSGLVLKPDEKESKWAGDLLLNLGVDPASLLIESESRNTYENAQFCSKLLKTKFETSGRFLLITSAFHMNRAQKCFEKTGLYFEYQRVDFIVDDDDYTLYTYLIPSAYTLDAWQLLIKEWLGYLAYWFKGYF